MAYFVLDANDSSDPGTECGSYDEAREVVVEYQKRYRRDFRIVHNSLRYDSDHPYSVGHDEFKY